MTAKHLPKFNVLSFRSTVLNLKILIKIDKKMVQTLSVDELRQRSAQAQDLIDKLQKQIEQIKIQTTPGFTGEKIRQLQKENENLRSEVEKLKQELEDAEKRKQSRKKYFQHSFYKTFF